MKENQTINSTASNVIRFQKLFW